MSKSHRALNLTGVLLPFLGVLLAIVLLWDQLVDWTSLAVLAGMYVISVMGVTSASTACSRTVRSLPTNRSNTFWRSSARWRSQGPVMNWVADHRKHHAHTDQEGDPHTPHGHGSGFKGAVTGLWYAHMGWLFEHSGTSEHQRYARDLYEDRGMQFIHRTFALWVAVGIAIPAAIGLAVTGTWRGAFEAALWGGAVRIFLVHHVTWSINSVCHFFGTPRASPSTITRPTSSGSPCSRWASPGTTTTTRSRAARSTACKSWETRPDGLGHPRDAARRSWRGTWSRSRPSASSRSSWPKPGLTTQ